MAKDSTEKVIWSSEHQLRSSDDRRMGIERRQYSGRSITVPDMRAGKDRRERGERRKIRLTITGRAIDV